MFDRRFATQSSTKKEALFGGKKLQQFFSSKGKKNEFNLWLQDGPPKKTLDNSLWVLNKPKKIIFWSKFDTISAWVQKKSMYLYLLPTISFY